MFFTLPEVTGNYPVGTTTLAVPVQLAEDEARIVGSALLKSTDGAGNTTPALKLQEVAFTVFYPADLNDITYVRNLPRTAGWTPEPVVDVLRGYAHFGKLNTILRLLLLSFGGLVRWLKYPAYNNARLLDPKHRTDAPGQPWPFVIFSHGLGGTRTSYTHICSRLASQGKVVVALEHKDGTGPSVQTRSPIPGANDEAAAESKLYLQPEEIEVVSSKEGGETFAFRLEQLLFRRLETYIAYTSFKELANTQFDTTIDRPDTQRMHTIDGPWNFKLENREYDKLFWKSWEPDNGVPKVQCDSNVTLSGHSFGGATVLSLLTQPPPALGKQTFPRIPVSHAVAFDPWVEPLPAPGPALFAIESSFEDHPRVPPELLVINAEGFTLWTDHFAKLRTIVDLWNGYAKEALGDVRAHLLTVVRAKHISFSDFALMFAYGRSGQESRKLLDIVCDLSLAFLDGKLHQALQEQNQASGEVEIVEVNSAPKSRLVGDVGDVVVHA